MDFEENHRKHEGTACRRAHVGSFREICVF